MRGGTNIQKVCTLQRGAADQAAVDVRHRKQLRGIVGLDAAAVENRQVGGIRHHLANERVNILRLLRRGGVPGTDGPDGFLGHDRVGEGIDDLRPFEARDFARALVGLEG